MKFPTLSAFCLFALMVLVLASDKKTRKELRKCMNKQLREDNEVAVSKYKLNHSELSKLEDLIRQEVNRIPLHHFDDQKQQAAMNHVKDVAKQSLPGVSTEKLNEILFKLKATAGHCVTDLKIDTK